MSMPLKFFKFNPYNFVPISKTPWGGSQIVHIKKKYLSNQNDKIPLRIGESIEAQVDFLLLKWIDATEPLSVQIHPKNSNPLLKPGECGKPEAWFVQSLCNPTPLYLGFKEGYSQGDITNCLLSNNPTDCLYSFIPNKNDYISIPTGCIHALGAGILIAEPQRIVPNQEGKTWRIFDWNRRYNTQGERDNDGMPRELHITNALSAIDWDLPRGSLLKKKLVTNLKNGDRFLGDIYNPFCVELYEQEGIMDIRPMLQDQFSFITVFEGMVTLSSGQETLELSGGESGFVPKSLDLCKIKIERKFQQNPCVLIFQLLSEKYV